MKGTYPQPLGALWAKAETLQAETNTCLARAAFVDCLIALLASDTTGITARLCTLAATAAVAIVVCAGCLGLCKTVKTGLAELAAIEDSLFTPSVAALVERDLAGRLRAPVGFCETSAEPAGSRTAGTVVLGAAGSSLLIDIEGLEDEGMLSVIAAAVKELKGATFCGEDVIGALPTSIACVFGSAPTFNKVNQG